MNEIRVTAEYISKPSNKFDALLAEFKAAKALAEATEAEKQPLIDAMGEAKLELIKKQLHEIAKKLFVIVHITGRGCEVKVEKMVNRYNYKVSVSVDQNYTIRIYLGGYDIDTSRKWCQWWFSEDGIVTKWNELKLYDMILKECEQRMTSLIDEQNKKIERINNTFNNMQNC
jgi:hypothetical protein